jgi:hypothetical protein
VGVGAGALLTALLLGPPASARPACTYAVDGKTNTTVTLGSSGGTVTVQVATRSDCTWTPNPDKSFLAIVGQSATTGNGTFTFSVAVLPSTAPPRTGKITVPAVGSPTYVVIQQSHNSL